MNFFLFNQLGIRYVFCKWKFIFSSVLESSEPWSLQILLLVHSFYPDTLALFSPYFVFLHHAFIFSIFLFLYEILANFFKSAFSGSSNCAFNLLVIHLFFCIVFVIILFVHFDYLKNILGDFHHPLVSSPFYYFISNKNDHFLVCRWPFQLIPLLFGVFTEGGLFLCMFCDWFWIRIHLHVTGGSPKERVEYALPTKGLLPWGATLFPLSLFPPGGGLFPPTSQNEFHWREAENMEKEPAGLWTNFPQSVQWLFVGFPRLCWIWCSDDSESWLRQHDEWITVFLRKPHFWDKTERGKKCHMYGETIHPETFFMDDDILMGWLINYFFPPAMLLKEANIQQKVLNIASVDLKERC